MGEIQDLQADHNRDLQIEGIIANQFLSQASLPKQIINEMLEEGLPVLPVRLSSLCEDEGVSSGLPTAHSYGPRPQTHAAICESSSCPPR